MMDQQAKFKNKHFSVEFVGESQSDRNVRRRVISGEVQLVYISPESIIQNSYFRNMLLAPAYKEKLVAVVVDEAHCIQTWGEKFRRSFSKLGELRSLIPSGVNIMALTATATTTTFEIVKEKLSLSNPVLVSTSPFRNNIAYRVAPKSDISEFCCSLCDELREKRIGYPKTIVYVRTYRDCYDIYLMIRRRLGREILHPPEAPNLSQFLMVDMFTRVNTNVKKEQIIGRFREVNSTLRIVIATSAFGMGVDCPDIRQVFHWGCPSEIEEYVQETGRAGRDYEDSVVTIFTEPIGRNASKQMREYLNNTTLCRRQFLFQSFLSYSKNDITVSGIKCCDVCQKSV